MATVQRARPSMGLQHELYRRSHRVPPPGEVHPERLLDMLSMECQRRKHQSVLTEDILCDERLDLDAIVDEFKIDDSISACFADIGSKKNPPKTVKSKSNKEGNFSKSFLNSSLVSNGGSLSSEILPERTSTTANDEHRFKIGIPSVMKIRFRRGKRQKNFPNVVEKSPYSPILEIPEEETSGSATDEQPIRTLEVNIQTSQLTDENRLSVVSHSDSTDDVKMSSADKPIRMISPETVDVTESKDIKKDQIQEKDPIECFLDELANGTRTNTLIDSIGPEKMTSWRDELGNSVVHRCILSGNTRAVTEITDMCPSLVTERNKSEEQPIDLAVQTGRTKCLTRLLELSEVREDVSLSTDDLERLITLSIVGNQAQSMAILLEMYKRKSEKLSFSVDKGGNSPAHIAAKLGRLHCLYVLHTYEFDMGGCNLKGLRPVHIANENGQQFCFRFLVQLETETRLVEQIVSRACTIDRYEMTVARFRSQIENDIQLIEPKLTEIPDMKGMYHTEIAEHVQKLLQEIADENTLQNRDTLLRHVENIKKVTTLLLDHIKVGFVDNLRNTLRRWFDSSVELGNLQNIANLQEETKVDTEEKRVIIGSIQTEVEESVLKDCQSQTTKSDSRSYKTSSVSNITSSSPVLHDDRNSVREINATGLTDATQDADDESSTSWFSSSKGKPNSKKFPAQNLECRSLNSSSQQTNFPEPMALLFEDSTDSDWSSSQSPLSSSRSARKWNKFSCNRMKVRPSKMVYGMLIPEITSRCSDSSTPGARRRRRVKGTSGLYQKRRASFWDLRDLRDRKSKNARFEIENEGSPPETLMHLRIEQHLKDTMRVKTNLVETVTMASGEVFAEDLDLAFHAELAQTNSREDNSCRGKKVQYRSDLINPSAKQTVSNKHSPSIKTKVSIRNLISKLAKKSKKPRSSVPVSVERAENAKTSERDVRSYTQSEFVERYRPHFGSSG